LAHWQAAGCSETVVKSGEAGCSSPDATVIAPDAVLDPVDTSGAGDAFNGGYSAERMRGADPRAAARAGHALAGWTIMRAGAIPADTFASPLPGTGSPEMTKTSASPVYDIVVVGGGINGAGIARDAAGRGSNVSSVEREDLASHTSSASTKRIHGGSRYLEYYEFRSVREALQERERSSRIAPHIIWPSRFVSPRPKGGRPGWMIRIGSWLYDHIGGKQSSPK
ncbi:hypothetical protein OY671_008903, partial [Metschnikowia pulcherrima]